MSTTLLLVSLVLVGADDVVPEATRWTVERPTKRARKDDVSVEATGERLVVVVTHRFGIDAATIRPDSGPWPRRVTVRFENFPALEGFTVTTPTRRAESSLGFGKEKSRVKVLTHDPESKDRKPLGEVVMPIVRRGKRIEVELPPELVPKGRDALNVRWIDAFRG